MIKPEPQRKPITRQTLIRAVASSTAIETGQSIKELEYRLNHPSEKFRHLTLAR
ncbi:hypothetical protein [Chitinibacter sp. S2-10]|uniref:hypothetical protein n=1 Tax=Chitinibacter sp. S2-10 TaxID=3373597 RepID=UPI0039774976